MSNKALKYNHKIFMIDTKTRKNVVLIVIM